MEDKGGRSAAANCGCAVGVALDLCTLQSAVVIRLHTANYMVVKTGIPMYFKEETLEEASEKRHRAAQTCKLWHPSEGD